MNKLAFLAIACVALAPATSHAAPVEVGAARLSLAVGARGEASASTKGMTVSAAPSDCFSYAPSHADILHVERTVKSETERGSKLRFEFRAQRAGSCAITFHSGKDNATVTVTVAP
ncbi:MAG TPA: hypothetical protein VIG46_09350 [Candidatus Baltobacteraceae bacterium]